MRSLTFRSEDEYGAYPALVATATRTLGRTPPPTAPTRTEYPSGHGSDTFAQSRSLRSIQSELRRAMTAPTEA
ncbi:hypothetical protein [Chloroflexus sp.]|uniref:hypothetical protein n=1 Tax=Chloroflexus sp. TaxID=1904827 RepID=UPI00258F94CF|nr:hypothetical protein [Chloroflexus sp.]